MPTRPTAKAPSQRQLRVGEELRHALSALLMRGVPRDPDLDGLPVTVSEVRCSPDLRNATAYVSLLGRDDNGPLLAALERNRGWLKGQIGRSVHLKYVPELSFAADTRFEEASRIAALLRDAPAGGDGDDDDRAPARDQD